MLFKHYRARLVLRSVLRETDLRGLGLDDLLVLAAFTQKPGAGSAWIGERLRGRGRDGQRLLGRRRINRAIGRLLRHDLLRIASDPADDQRSFEATEEGATKLTDIMLAAEVSLFEPDDLAALLNDEARGPFRRYRGRVEF